MKKTALALLLALVAGPLAAAAPKPAPKELIEASGQGNTAELARLLKAGADVNGTLASGDAGSDGMSALTIAATLGQVESVKTLLAAKAKINLTDGMGDTALHKACYPPSGKDPAANALARIQIAKLLLAAKTKVNLKDKQGWTPLMLASAYGGTELVKLLLDAGADASVKLSSGKTAFLLAQQGGHKETAALLEPKKGGKQ